MKIATWNVNSIRVRCDAVVGWLKKHEPDVLCVQETKVENGKFPWETFKDEGYRAAFSGEKSYNGVAIFSKHPISDVQIGFPETPIDEQRRLIAATVMGVRLINVYIPNGESVDSPKFIYKLNFIARLKNYLDRCYKTDMPLTIVGDFNVAPEARDVYDPKEWEGEILCHPKEREALMTLMSWGLIDLFRMHHQEGGYYSWWDYRMGAFRRNMGIRIDHIWATPPFASRCVLCEIDKAPRADKQPSDHAPMMATFV